MQNSLMKVNNNEGRQTVLGRDLHEFLEVGTYYTDWFNKICDYGFIEKVDYVELFSKEKCSEGNRTVQRNIINHQLTIEMAKEISMIQRTERGKMARKYFIECEQKLKETLTPSYKLPTNYVEALKMLTVAEEEKQLYLQQLETKEKEVICRTTQVRKNIGRQGGKQKQTNKVIKSKDNKIDELQNKIEFLKMTINNLI